MPFKSEKQRRYLWANEPEIARDWADTYGSRIKKKNGGITNTVTVPKHWQSAPDHPKTELAYITKKEKDLLLKKDLHNSLKDGPNVGPGGVMSLNGNYGGTYRTGAEVSAAEAGKKDAFGKSEANQKAAAEARAGFIAAGGGQDRDKSKDTEEVKTQIKEIKKASKKKLRKVKKEDRKASYNKRQIDYLQKQKLNAIISRLNRRGYTDFKKGETTFEDIQEWLGTLSPGHPAMQPGGDASLVERWQDFKDKKGNPLYDKDTIEKWEKSGYVPNYPGTTGIGSLDIIGDIFGTPALAKNQIQDYLDTYTAIGESGDMNWLDRMKKFEPHRYAQHQGDITWNPVQGKFEPKSGGGGGGGGGVSSVGSGQPATLPIVPPEEEVSAFQQSLTGGATGSGLPFKDYYVGDSPTAANLAWGQQMGVDPRTMGLTAWAADGGRIGRAYGGIMDTATGRRAYGLGSIFKKIGRAAKKVLKSPIGKAALLGLGGYYLGGGQGLWGKQMFGQKFGENFALKNLMQRKGIQGLLTKDGAGQAWDPWKIGIAGATALPFFMGGGDDDDDDKFDYEGAKNAYRDEMMRIKAGALAGTLDPNKFNYLGRKDGGRIGLQDGGDPFLREEYNKYVFEMEEMGLEPMTFEQFKDQARAGMYAGGQSVPSDYTMEDARMTTTQDKLGGITEAMKRADLNRQGSVGQFYAADGGKIMEPASDQTKHQNIMMLIELFKSQGMNARDALTAAQEQAEGFGKAQGGRIGYAGGSGRPPITKAHIPTPQPMPGPQAPQRPNPMPAPQPNRMAGMNPMMGGMHPMMNRPMMNPMMNRPMMNPMMGGRRMAQEGGLMDLGGMEKDYRNEGGFVPLGGEEKADDVPARLSKNEFVFTADAVRGAGNGDIDKGAEIMENVMKNLEQGGEISEETQGLSGAQEMFGVSERLSEVV